MRNQIWKMGAALLGAFIGISSVGCGRIASENGQILSVKAELPKDEEDSRESFYGEGYSSRDDAKDEWRQKEKNVDMGKFYQDTLPCFLGQAQENTVYSPLNVYLALSMLAEIGEGETQKEIFNLLQVKDPETLREHVNALWNTNYDDAENDTCLLANSLWLNDKIHYKEETLKTLAEKYHASSFSGTMGSESLNQELHDWINENTNNLLKDSADSIKLSPETVMELVSTIYYKSFWTEKFSQAETKKEVFHGLHGDSDVEMMHRSTLGSIYRTDQFTGLSLGLSSGEMYFILPEKNTELSALLEDENVMDFLGISGKDWEETEANRIYAEINMSIPKFDLHSKINLKDGLKKLGIECAFDRKKANFKKLFTDDGDIWLDHAHHAAMVKIDEEGVTGAAYTDLGLCGAAMPQETIDFILDRPFYYVITAKDGSLLFAGTAYDINQ